VSRIEPGGGVGLHARGVAPTAGVEGCGAGVWTTGAGRFGSPATGGSVFGRGASPGGFFPPTAGVEVLPNGCGDVAGRGGLSSEIGRRGGVLVPPADFGVAAGS
jgi:hypothetical protein